MTTLKSVANDVMDKLREAGNMRYSMGYDCRWSFPYEHSVPHGGIVIEPEEEDWGCLYLYNADRCPYGGDSDYSDSVVTRLGVLLVWATNENREDIYSGDEFTYDAKDYTREEANDWNCTEIWLKFSTGWIRGCLFRDIGEEDPYGSMIETIAQSVRSNIERVDD